MTIQSEQRYLSLDLLRGIALGGILVMNITSFAMPGTAYSNPMAFGGDSIANHLVFIISHIFFDQKMMGLFSLLFGASAMLFMDKLQRRDLSTARYYYTRIFWLILFGIAHGIFLWAGDILFFYGLCGLLLFFLRRLPSTALFLLGLVVFFAAIIVGEYANHWLNSMPPFQIEQFHWAWQPKDYDISGEIHLRLGNYAELLRYRMDTSELNPNYPVSHLTRIFIAQGVLRALGLMLVGMALYGWGVFKAKSSVRSGVFLLIIGAILASVGLWQHYQQDWTITYSMFHGRIYNHFATPLIVIAYVLIFVNIAQQSLFLTIQKYIANYGRMAFSNYIFQSLICTTLFYGYGFGLFAEFTRWQLMQIVLLILLLQIIASNLWLRFFYYGPLEWLWRLLTFFKLP